MVQAGLEFNSLYFMIYLEFVFCYLGFMWIVQRLG